MSGEANVTDDKDHDTDAGEHGMIPNKQGAPEPRGAGVQGDPEW